jgi:predicted O-methyltransferase YrrM
MKHTIESLKETQKISDEMNGKTFHHHYHILLDIVNQYPEDELITYVEIGCYAGGSACLVSQRKNTKIFSIDLGSPISPEIPKQNFEKFNVYGNDYQYIQGSSHSPKTINQLKTFINEIDVLFIDGDHSLYGVKEDFNIYSPLVKIGGYIIFDDYNDYIHSPEVKIGVNQIIQSIDNYEIIGTLPNIYDARPSELKEGNCFIIKKIK